MDSQAKTAKIGQQPPEDMLSISLDSMEYALFVRTIVAVPHLGQQQQQSHITYVIVDADLGLFSDFGFPPFFVGKLLDVTGDQILRFKSAAALDVRFRGLDYRFELLQPNGMFKVVRQA